MRVICPVDFSEASRTALRHAELVAEHFGAPLTVLTVNDPLLAEAAAMRSSVREVKDDTRRALEDFSRDGAAPGAERVRATYEVRIGDPAREILAASGKADLVVMSSHGLTGIRKLFFGSVAERVLRETHVPVLIVRGDRRAPMSLADARASVRRVLVPVAFEGNASQQLATAQAIADASGASLLLLHAIEPIRTPVAGHAIVARVDRERRLSAEARLHELGDGLKADIEWLVTLGEPAEEIANVARDRKVDLIVIRLRSSASGAARVGSVAYRVVSASTTPILALPPAAARARAARSGKTARRAKKPAASKTTRRSRR